MAARLLAETTTFLPCCVRSRTGRRQAGDVALDCGASGDGALADGGQRRAESRAGPTEMIQAKHAITLNPAIQTAKYAKGKELS